MAADDSYRVELRAGGEVVTLRPFVPADREAVLDFARALPAHDLLFLRRDITDEAVVDGWLRDIAAGTTRSLLAWRGEAMAGYVTVERSSATWSAHVAELRVTVAPALRGRGLGLALVRQAFAIGLEMGVEKMVAQMTADQEAAIATFQGLGFRPEAVLRDHVRDRAGRYHDLFILSHGVAGFTGRPRPAEVMRAFERR